jgi:outer membrane receptor protein involved in Fe transport
MIWRHTAAARSRSRSFFHCLSATLVVSSLLCAPAAIAAMVGELSDVIVTATWRPLPSNTLSASVTVLDHDVLSAAGTQHVEDVLALVPNLNWASGTARPRYFQIRGIGELQQYQGAPNPSIGFLIDDMDLSGLATAATLFDMGQMDVLRGPQGARYGANALGGLIYATSAAPAQSLGGYTQLGVANDNTRTLGAVLTGPIDSLHSSVRVALQRYTSDGYYNNTYLHDRRVGRFDENTARLRWHLAPSDRLSADIALLRVAIHDGYDAFSIHNNRLTQSDQPGQDAQTSTGASLNVRYLLQKNLALTTIVSAVDTPMTYAYDGDWGNASEWAPSVYVSSDTQSRHRTTRNVELRLAHDSDTGSRWIVGLYALSLREALQESIYNLYQDPTSDYLPPASVTNTDSHYMAVSRAVFGSIDQPLSSRLTFSGGLRVEQRAVSYHDTTLASDATATSHAFSPKDTLWGGNLALNLHASTHTMVYALISRGYKAGGFNLSDGLPANELMFQPETDLNMELGYKYTASSQLHFDATIFYAHRSALQLLTGTQLQPSDPSSFVYYTGNAATGFNYGLESQLEWRYSERWTVGGMLGLLQTRYSGFIQDGLQFPDRALPHAPPWQAALHLAYTDPGGRFARIEVTGLGGFYFDMPPNPTTSTPYALVNAHLGMEKPRWSLALWGRNLLNKDYAVRGFYFGVVPPDFNNATYTQLGPPRTVGLTLTVRY